MRDGVINDRFATRLTAPRQIGLQPPGIHYDFTTPEYTTFDEVQTEKWETCRGISNSFEYAIVALSPCGLDLHAPPRSRDETW